MILLIDNYDSFSYNLYHLMGQFEPDIRVVRNDAVTIADIEALSPEALVLSPGDPRRREYVQKRSKPLPGSFPSSASAWDTRPSVRPLAAALPTPENSSTEKCLSFIRKKTVSFLQEWNPPSRPPGTTLWLWMKIPFPLVSGSAPGQRMAKSWP